MTDTSSFFDGPKRDTMPMDRWDRYLLPGADGTTTGWTRATTFADSLANPYALNQWQQRQVALGLGRRPDLLALASTISGPEDKDALADIVRQAHEAAETQSDANMGTALHAARQNRIVHGMEPSPNLIADVLAMESKVAEYGCQAVRELTERVVIVPEYHVAGRWDEVWRCPDGKLRIGDTKTGKLEPYNHLKFCIQVALYAHASAMWDEQRKCYVPMPQIERDYAFILHCRPGSRRPEIHRVNISLGWALARLCQEARDARKLDGLITPAPIPVGPVSGLPSAVPLDPSVSGSPLVTPLQAQQFAQMRQQLDNPTQVGTVPTTGTVPGGFVDSTSSVPDEIQAFWSDDRHDSDDPDAEFPDPREQAGTPGDTRPPSQVLKDSTPLGEVRIAADATARMWNGAAWQEVHAAQKQGPAAHTLAGRDGQDYHAGDLASQCPVCNPHAPQPGDVRVEQPAEPLPANDRPHMSEAQLDAMVESFVKVAKTKARVQEVARKALAAMGLPESTVKLQQQQRKIARALIELAVERGHDLTAQLPGAWTHVESMNEPGRSFVSEANDRPGSGEQPSGMPPAPKTEPGATMHAQNYEASVIARIGYARTVGELQELRSSVGAAWTDGMTEAARVKTDELNAADGQQPLTPLQQIEGATSNDTIQRVWRSITREGEDPTLWTDEMQTAASKRLQELSQS